MRVGIITDIFDINANITGPGVYTYNLVKGLNAIDQKNEYYLIHYREVDLDVYKSNKEIIIPLPRFFKMGKGLIWRNMSLPLRLKGRKLDIVHDTYEAGFFSFKTPFKKIMTIHETAFIRFPGAYRRRGMAYYKYLFPLIVKNTDMIITPSESTKRDLVTYLKVPEDKIRVIYEAADERFKPLDKTAIIEVRQKYGLDFPFILYVGLMIPKKNIPALIKAYNKLKKTGMEHKLVITGRKAPRVENAEIFEIVERLNLQKDVIFTGYIPPDDLPGLYNAADLFVYPSFNEGFGLPPLEAMACGTPVITSNTSSLPGVVGDAGIMIDPYDIEGLAEAMDKVLTNQALRQEMIKKGLKRAKRFSWEKMARETLKVYESVLNQG